MRIFSPLVLILTSWSAAASSLSLSQKDVAELVLKQSTKAREVALRYEQTRLGSLTPLLAYEWKLTAETGFDTDRTENLSRVGDFRYDTYKTGVGLSKSLLTGTLLRFDYSRTSQKNDLATATYNQLSYDSATFTLEQAILGNFLGVGDRAAVRKAELDYEAGLILRADELEGVVLEALRLFWNTYVAKENFRESLAARDRYEKLVSSVKRKSSYGYTSPGELAQVQAEFETRVQTVKTASLDYLKSLDNLLSLLELPAGTEISFVVPRELPPVPKLVERKIEDLRVVRSQKLKVEAADAGVSLARSKDAPALSLVGQYAASGVDESSSAAYAELTSGSYPRTYVGLKLSYSFGSGISSEDVANKKAALALEELRLKKSLEEQRDLDAQAERKVSATFAIAQSARIQRDLRNKAVQELTRSYNQGRTDISVLIDAINRLLTTEIQSARALGDYQIALNEWAATRDELIPDRKEETR